MMQGVGDSIARGIGALLIIIAVLFVAVVCLGIYALGWWGEWCIRVLGGLALLVVGIFIGGRAR